MFARLFEKYARAVSDGRERDWLFSKFKLKTVVSIIFYALCVVVIVLALTLEPVIEEPWAFMLLTAVVFAWIVMGITSLVLWISFRRSYKNILNRPASDGEMPEITAYRQKTAEANRSNFKKLWWAWLIFGMCAVAFIVLIALDVISNPDSESMGVYGTAAFWVLLAGALALVLSYILKSTINRQNGQTLEQSTADEVKAIDEAQGRETKYSLQSDPNLSSYKYLFPEPALYEKAEGVRKRYAKFATFGIAAVMIVAVAAVILLLFSENLGMNISGYAMPVGLTIAFFGCVLINLSANIKLTRIEKEQVELLKSNPGYAKNLEWYNLYNDFSRFKGKLYILFFVIGIALGWALAILFPDKAWALFCIAPVISGLAINQVLVKKLRQKAIPIEREIDARNGQNPLEDNGENGQ